jgi:hypothetical protein
MNVKNVRKDALNGFPISPAALRKAIGTVLLGFFVLLLVPNVGLSQQPGEGDGSAAPYVASSGPPQVSHGTPDSILVITYTGGFGANTFNVHNTLVALGYTVTHVVDPAAGVIAATLAAGTFQQVWLWDVTSSLQISPGDAAAVGNWYLLNSQGNIAVDGRSYGAFFDIANDQFLVDNLAHAFSSRCGGLWLGSDHATAWANQVNAVLTAVGYSNVSGSAFPGVLVGDYGSLTSTEILTVPNVLVPAALNGPVSSGQPPAGVQGDGTDLLPVLRAATGQILTTAALETNFCSIPVDIDIKFCSNPNGFNCKNRGVTPVTVFGTEDFDVNDIDVSSLQLCLADLSLCTTSAPPDFSVADRGDPTEDIGASQCAVIDDVEQDFRTLDGWDDLDVAFHTQDVVSVIGCGGLSKGDASSTLVLIGETNGGTPIFSVPVDDVGIDQLLIQKN